MKRAVVVATNYAGTSYELHGCLNDGLDMGDLLRRFNFDEVVFLFGVNASTANIKIALWEMKRKAQANDLNVFTYSGHGSNQPDPTESDGYAELICPNDFDWSPGKMIADEWFAEYLKDISGKFVAILDCCHSGDGLREIPKPNQRERYISPINEPATRRSKAIIAPNYQANGILLAGCQANQTSADAVIDNRPCGAFTYFLRQALAKANDRISYQELIKETANALKQNGYEQQPELDCKSDHLDELFLT